MSSLSSSISSISASSAEGAFAVMMLPLLLNTPPTRDPIVDPPRPSITVDFRSICGVPGSKSARSGVDPFA